jgi:hypothetical protein
MGTLLCLPMRYELKEKINQIFNIFIEVPICPPWIGHFMIFWNEAFELLDKNINYNEGFEFAAFLGGMTLLDLDNDVKLIDRFIIQNDVMDDNFQKNNDVKSLDQFLIQNNVMDDLENDISMNISMNTTENSCVNYMQHSNVPLCEQGNNDILQKNNLFIHRLQTFRKFMLRLESVIPAIPLLDKTIDVYIMTDPDKNFVSITDDSHQALLKIMEILDNTPPKCKNPECEKKVTYNDYQRKYYDYCSSECLPQNIKEKISKCANPACNKFTYYCMRTDTYSEYCSTFCNLKTMLKKT